MNIIHDKHNLLLKRKELMVSVHQESNPSTSAAKTMIAQSLSVSEDLVVIKSIRNRYGVREFHIESFVYDSAESLDKTEQKAKEKKK